MLAFCISLHFAQIVVIFCYRELYVYIGIHHTIGMALCAYAVMNYVFIIKALVRGLPMGLSRRIHSDIHYPGTPLLRKYS